MLNEKYIGKTDNPKNYVADIIEKKRTEKIPNVLNIYYNQEFNEIYIDTTKGRTRRLLVVVKDGKSLLTEDLVSSLLKNETTWDQL
jgi:hypothetical protein